MEVSVIDFKGYTKRIFFQKVNMSIAADLQDNTASNIIQLLIFSWSNKTMGFFCIHKVCMRDYLP